LFQFIKIVLLLFYFPPNPLLNKIVFGSSLVLFKVLFLCLVLPLFVFGIYCVFKSFFEKELFFKGIGVVVFVTFSLLATYFIGMNIQIHPHYVIIVLPLLGLLLFKYLFELKNQLIKKVLITLFFVFGVYGFCYSLVSTVYHIMIWKWFVLIVKKSLCATCGREVELLKDNGVYRCSRGGIMSGHRVRRVTYFNCEKVWLVEVW